MLLVSIPVRLSCLWWVLGCLAFVGQVKAEFTVVGRQIQQNGENLLLRGVCYQPTPIGQNPSQAPPYGDYFTGNYQSIYQRDLPLMREMGCNMIRVYGWTPGADHSDFLAQCYNNGDRPILVLINRWINPATNWSDPTAVTQIQNEFVAMTTEANQSPAVLGFLLGNENNIAYGNGTNPAFWAAHNSIAGTLKTAAPDKLVSMAITDAVGSVASYDSVVTNLDFWSLQIYRGNSMGSLFSQYQSASSKPLVITEFGMDAYDARVSQPFANNAAYTAQVVGGLWAEILDNRSICAGGAVFEWTDEWWKSVGLANAHDSGGFTNFAFVDQQMNEEWWGIFSVSSNANNPDTITPRALFDTLKQAWLTPNVALTIDRDAGLPQLQINHTRSDVILRLLASTDQMNWETIAESNANGGLVGIPNESLLISGTTETIQVVDQSVLQKRFYRLEASRIGP